MDIKKQAIVLIHELFMGIKILRFESPRTKCKVFSSISESCESLSTLRLYPHKSLDELITQDDYAEVRAMTNLLLDEWKTLSINDLNQLLINNHFSIPDFSFPHNKLKERIIYYNDIVEAIKGAQTAKRLPKYYFDEQGLEQLLMENYTNYQFDAKPILWKNKGACDFQFSEINEKSMKVKINVEIKPKKKDGKKTTIQKEVILYNNSFKISNLPSNSILMRDWTQEDVFNLSLTSKSEFGMKERVKYQLGDKYWDMRFSFQNNSDLNLSAISFSEFVCSKNDCMTWSQIEGSEINCSIQSAIFYGQDEDLSLKR